MSRLLAICATVLAATAIPATAAADPDNVNSVEVTLDCGANGTFTGTSIFQSNALPFAITAATTQAIAMEISFVDNTGTTVVVRDQPGMQHQQLIQCTYLYPGFPFLVTGQFMFTSRN